MIKVIALQQRLALLSADFAGTDRCTGPNNQPMQIVLHSTPLTCGDPIA